MIYIYVVYICCRWRIEIWTNQQARKINIFNRLSLQFHVKQLEWKHLPPSPQQSPRVNPERWHPAKNRVHLGSKRGGSTVFLWRGRSAAKLLIVQRNEKKCPFCYRPVCRLNRHLARVHNRRPLSTAERHTAQPRRKCPLCVRKVTRMDKHLLRYHKLSQASPVYEDAMRQYFLAINEERLEAHTARSILQEQEDTTTTGPSVTS